MSIILKLENKEAKELKAYVILLSTASTSFVSSLQIYFFMIFLTNFINICP